MPQGAPGTETKSPAAAEDRYTYQAAPQHVYRGAGGLSNISAQVLNYQAEKRRMLQQESWQRQATQLGETMNEEFDNLPEIKALGLAKTQFEDMQDADLDDPNAYTDEQMGIASRRVWRKMTAAVTAKKSAASRIAISAPDNPFVQQMVGDTVASQDEVIADFMRGWATTEAAIADATEHAQQLEVGEAEGARERAKIGAAGEAEIDVVQAAAAEERVGAEQAGEIGRRGMRAAGLEADRRQRAAIKIDFEENPEKRVAMVQGIATAYSAMEENGYPLSMIEAALEPVSDKLGIDVSTLIDEAKLVGKEDTQKKIKEWQRRQQQAEAAGDTARAAKYQARVDEAVERDQLAADEQATYEEHLADMPLGARAGTQLVDMTVSAAYTAAGIVAAPFQFAGAILEEGAGALSAGVATAAQAGEGDAPAERPLPPERADRRSGLRERARAGLSKRLGE